MASRCDIFGKRPLMTKMAQNMHKIRHCIDSNIAKYAEYMKKC